MIPAWRQGRIGNALELELPQVLQMIGEASTHLTLGNLLTLVHITHIVVIHVARVLFTVGELEHVVALTLSIIHNEKRGLCRG